MSESLIIEGLKRTIKKIKTQKSDLEKEVNNLKKDLGILEEEGFLEKPSLPLIKFDVNGIPYCEKHGALNVHKHRIYRCEACKTAVQLRSSNKTGEENE